MADHSLQGVKLPGNATQPRSNSVTTLVGQKNEEDRTFAEVDSKKASVSSLDSSSAGQSSTDKIEGPKTPGKLTENSKNETEAAAHLDLEASLAPSHRSRHSFRYEPPNPTLNDVFGDEEGNDIQYKTMDWGMTAFLMISEVVSNGVLALPSAASVVGLVPMAIIVLFLGIFGTYTGLLLVAFKLRYPKCHNMGDAGDILFGKIGGEIFYWGTIVLTILAQGSHILAGTFALAAFSGGNLCMMVSAAIFVVPCIIGSMPRRLADIQWLGVVSAGSILLAGTVGMIGAGANPTVGRTISAVVHSSFYRAFVAVTSPVFAFAGHFIFFVLIAEMKKPEDAKKSVYALQAFSTTFYLVFVIVMYCYQGNDAASPSFNSLPTAWKIASYAVAIPSFIISAMLAAHIAVKLLFIKYLRNTKYAHWISSNNLKGWIVWTLTILLINGIGIVLAIGVPIFNRLLGLTASLFASWYSYGFSGMFELHMLYMDEAENIWDMLKQHPTRSTLAILTVLAGAFICVAGTYVTIRGIIEEYNSGRIGTPFTC